MSKTPANEARLARRGVRPLTYPALAALLGRAAALPPLRRQGARGHVVWTPGHDACLGEAPDVDLAAAWGLPHQPIWRRRTRLGILPFGSTCGRSVQWSEDMLRALGRMSDRAVAQQFGIAAPTVALKRQSLGLSDGQRRITWTAEMLAALGTDGDHAIATRFHLSRNSVSARRRALGIPPCRPGRYDWRGPEVAAVLGSLPDRTLARRLGVDPATIRRHRLAAGIVRSGSAEPWAHTACLNTTRPTSLPPDAPLDDGYDDDRDDRMRLLGQCPGGGVGRHAGDQDRGTGLVDSG